MNKHFKYDPEDIESLMLAKSFDELLPEERVFVLKHLSSEREYESMRHLLLDSMEVLQSDQPEPPQDLKDKMMAQYRSHHETNTFGKIWLNFFAPMWTNLWQRPYLSLAMASVVLFLGVIIWIESDDTTQMAVQNEPEQIERRENPAAKPVQEQAEETKQDSPSENSMSENGMEAPQVQQKSIAEKAAADVVQQNNQQELSEPETSAAPEQELDDVFIAEDESTEETQTQSSGNMDFATESRQPTVAGNSATGALASETATSPTASRTSVINDELIALLYTAR